MSVVSTVKLVGVGAVALTLSEWLGWLFRRLRPSRRSTQEPLNEVFFFPCEVACVDHLFTPPSVTPWPCFCPLPHGVETSFARLLRHVLSASALDLCVFSFSNLLLRDAVLTLHNRGLPVRILTDRNYAFIKGSQIKALRKAGVCVRRDSSPGSMHHKFAIVDGRRLITGSLNWTMGAVLSNKENVLVTEEPDLVQPFAQEFQRLWDINDPATHRIAEKPASLSV